MLRYLVLVGDVQWRQQITACAAKLFMRPAIVSDPMDVLRNDVAEACCQTLGDSLLFGTIYPRSGFGPPQRPAILADHQFRPDIIRDHFWGSYVFLRASPDGVEVFRDPTGRVGGVHAAGDHGVAIASDVDLLVDLGIVSGVVDWAECAIHLSAALEPRPHTAIAGVDELLPGFCLAASGNDRTIERWWDPWTAAARTPLSRGDATMLRQSIEWSVAALTGDREEILVRVSGGLDSSIVAAAVAKCRPTARLLTLVAGSGDGDERLYARVLSDGLGLPLLEAHYDARRVNLAKPSYPQLPRPHGRILSQAIADILADHLDDPRKSIVLTGHGGDNIFCYQQSVRPLADRWLSGGRVSEIWASLLDLCHLTHASVGHAVAALMRQLIAGPVGHRWTKNHLFLREDCVQRMAAVQPHPWLMPPRDALPGKAFHIAMLLGSLDHVGTLFDGAVPTEISPLQAQPVIEHCLAVPSWNWIAGGVDRSVARTAFVGRLPQMLLDRRTKGGPDRFCTALIDRQKQWVSERLLDGLLSSHDILDRCAILRALRDDAPTEPLVAMRLLELLDAEAWAQYRMERSDEARCPGN